MNGGNAARPSRGFRQPISANDRCRIHAAIDRLLDRTIDAQARERSYLLADAVQETTVGWNKREQEP
jgi:hypothetical protein